MAAYEEIQRAEFEEQ